MALHPGACCLRSHEQSLRWTVGGRHPAAVDGARRLLFPLSARKLPSRVTMAAVKLPTQRLYGTSFTCQICERHKDATVGDEVWGTLVKEFSDVPDASAITRITVRLVIAAVLGGVLGFERESKGRSAGLRTHMLVAVGAALFVLGPLQSGMQIGDLSRVLQGVVQGIGFLGAGAIIIRSAQREVEGLTTAASIWATAAIGVMAGLGMEVTAVLSTAIVLVILAAVPHILPTPSETDSKSSGDD